MSVEQKHAEVLAAINRNEPCHAQAVIDGVVVSWHPSLGGVSYTAAGLSHEKMNPGFIKGKIIDLWVQGEGTAKVSPGTFTRAELLFRADEHRWGNGPGIIRGAWNEPFADQIEAFAEQRAADLAERAC